MDLFYDLEKVVRTLLSCSGRDCLKERMVSCSWFYLLIVSLLCRRSAAPYGKFVNSSAFFSSFLGLRVPAWLAWFLQEVPALLVPTLAAVQVISSGETYKVAYLAPFILHYFNRSIIFPLSAKKGRPVPVLTVVLAFLFCLWNGFMQSFFVVYINNYFQSYFLGFVGLLLFTGGLYINIQSDYILTNLRKPGETEYKIPYGGFFDFISAPNYFGEILEWWGWFLVCPNPASLWFAIFSTMFLGTRALHTHAFYKEKFKESYPATRRAIIPRVL